MGFIGAYDKEKDAAHTYDLAALKYWGKETVLNFPVSRTLLLFYFCSRICLVNLLNQIQIVQRKNKWEQKNEI